MKLDWFLTKILKLNATEKGYSPQSKGTEEVNQTAIQTEGSVVIVLKRPDFMLVWWFGGREKNQRNCLESIVLSGQWALNRR